MRISTALFHQLGASAILNQQFDVAKVQQELATGKRIQNPSEDPVRAARILDVGRTLAGLGQYDDNAGRARDSLQYQDSTFGQITEIIQNVRERTVQMANASQSNETRAFGANEIQGYLNELLSLANTTDESGHYLFAGSQSNTTPFAQSGGGVVYQGDQGALALQVSGSRQMPVTESGNALFMQINEGNGTFVTAPGGSNTGTGVIDGGTVLDASAWVADTYTLTFTPSASNYELRNSGGALVTSGAYTSGSAISFNGVQFSVNGAPAVNDTFTLRPATGQSIFATLSGLVQTLSTSVNSEVGRVALTNNINTGLRNIDQALGHFLTTRASIGARWNELDGLLSANDETRIQFKAVLSNLEDADYADASTRLNQKLLGLQAAQQAYARVSQLSLFNYLN